MHYFADTQFAIVYVGYCPQSGVFTILEIFGMHYIYDLGLHVPSVIIVASVPQVPKNYGAADTRLREPTLNHLHAPTTPDNVGSRTNFCLLSP